MQFGTQVQILPFSGPTGCLQLEVHVRILCCIGLILLIIKQCSLVHQPTH